jgi:hypothetical protein
MLICCCIGSSGVAARAGRLLGLSEEGTRRRTVPRAVANDESHSERAATGQPRWCASCQFGWHAYVTWSWCVFAVDGWATENVKDAKQQGTGTVELGRMPLDNPSQQRVSRQALLG